MLFRRLPDTVGPDFLCLRPVVARSQYRYLRFFRTSIQKQSRLRIKRIRQRSRGTHIMIHGVKADQLRETA